MIAERKRFFAAQRAAEQKSKPPTKTRMRNRMYTCLKNMGGYKHNQLKGNIYKEIQKLFDKTYKQVNSFVPMASDDKEKSSEKKAGGSNHVQSEAVSEQLEIEKDGLSEQVQKKKRKRGESDQDLTYDQLMTIVTTLEGTVATLTNTVSSLHGTIGTLESRLLALEGDAHISTLTQTVSSL
ncbi:hypothetical protein Tco_0298284 [Tanacetum coccineum]